MCFKRYILMEKQCKQCQGLILQRPNESAYRYKQKKYCSQVCSHAHMKENKVGWYASPAVKISGKPKHHWDDLSVQPYLNDDNVVTEKELNEDRYF